MPMHELHIRQKNIEHPQIERSLYVHELRLLLECWPVSFYYSTFSQGGYAKVRKWTKGSTFRDDFKKILLDPINIKNKHWIVGGVNIKDETIFIYDPRFGQHAEELKHLKRYIGEALFDWTGTDLNVGNWKTAQEIPRQTNASDCGILMCGFIEKLYSKS